MATLEDARRLALALPEVTEKISWGHPMWCVRDKGFAWERPLRRPDLAELGAGAPTGEILGVRVAGEAAKAELLASSPEVCFTIRHLDGYPAVLVRLEAVGADELAELVTDAWLDRAPRRLAAGWLSERGLPPP